MNLRTTSPHATVQVLFQLICGGARKRFIYSALAVEWLPELGWYWCTCCISEQCIGDNVERTQSSTYLVHTRGKASFQTAHNFTEGIPVKPRLVSDVSNIVYDRIQTGYMSKVPYNVNDFRTDSTTSRWCWTGWSVYGLAWRLWVHVHKLQLGFVYTCFLFDYPRCFLLWCYTLPRDFKVQHMTSFCNSNSQCHHFNMNLQLVPGQ